MPQDPSAHEGSASALLSSLRFAVEHQTEGLAILNPQGRFLYVNPAFSRMSGYQPGELIGQSWKVLYEATWQATIEQEYVPVLIASGSWKGEAVARRKDGPLFDQELSLSAIKNEQGELTGFVCNCRDVSERRRIDRELRESRRRLAEAELAAKCGHWVWDVRRGLVSLSPGTRALYGLDPTTEEVSLEQVFSIIHPDDRARIRSVTEQVLRERRAVPAEFRVVHPDGNVRTLFGDGTATVNAAGELLSLTGSLIDVTDRRNKEQEARRQAQILESFWKFAPACFVILDRNFNFIRVNDMYARACGRNVDDFPGHNHFEFYPSDAQAIFEQVRSTKKPFEILARPFVFPDHPEWGTTYWDWSLVPILDAAGEVELFAFSLKDVTEQKRGEADLAARERLLRLMQETGPACVKRVSSDGQILSINSIGLALIEADSLPEMAGLSVFDLVTREHRKAFEDMHRAVIGGEARTLTYEILGLKGTRRWMETHAVPFRNPNTGLTEHLGVSHDITDRKRAEETIKLSERSIRELHSLSADTSLSFHQKLQRLLALGCLRFRLPIGILSKIEDERYEVMAVQSSGDVIPQGAVFPLGQTYCRETLQADKPIGFEHARESEWRIHPCYREFRLEAYLGVRVVVAGRTFGTLNFSSHHPFSGSFTAADKDFLQLMARWIGEELERREAERALRAGEARFRVLYDDSPSMYFTVNTAGIVLSVNRFGAERLGYRPDELIGGSVLAVVHEQDRDIVRQSLAKTFADPDQLAKLEFRKVTRQGTVIWVRETMRVLPAAAAAAAAAAGSGPVALITCEDITDRKRAEQALQASEERFRTFTEYFPGPAFIKNANGQHLFVNPAFEQALHLRRSDWEAKTNDELFPSDIAAEINRHDQQVFRDGKSLQVMEQVEQDGQPRQYLVTKFLIPDEQGHASLLGGIALDVTERKLAEQRLRQAEKMESLGTLAGGIAHDFNNILAAMIGYTELAQDGVAPDSRTRQNLDQVLTAGRRAKALVQQILAFSRHREPQRKRLDLARLLQEAMTLLRASIPTTIAMQVDVRASESVVLADPTQLQQVIMNLCSNAAQAMRERGGTLGLRLEEVDVLPSFAAAHPPLKAGGHIRLTITDTGIGMTPEVLARIFDPFFTTKKVGEGTGLGLSASLGIVTGHGGTITVESERGRGSTFAVYLPKLVAPAHDAHGAQASRRGGSERILFVDDETALVRLADQTLGNLGYRVTVLTDPVLALGQFRSEPDAFDLVITDQTMPGMTGEVLARELLRLRPSLPIILCTGFSEGMSEQAARKAGFRGLLMKPLTVAELDRAIHDALAPCTNPTNRV